MGEALQIEICAHVDNNHACTGMAGHDVGACGSPSVAVDHLKRYFLGKCADSVFADTVIAAHKEHHRFQSPDTSAVRHHQVIGRQIRQYPEIFTRQQHGFPVLQHFLPDVFIWQFNI